MNNVKLVVRFETPTWVKWYVGTLVWFTRLTNTHLDTVKLSDFVVRHMRRKVITVK